jgi:hypothetical protein
VYSRALNKSILRFVRASLCSDGVCEKRRNVLVEAHSFQGSLFRKP